LISPHAHSTPQQGRKKEARSSGKPSSALIMIMILLLLVVGGALVMQSFVEPSLSLSTSPPSSSAPRPRALVIGGSGRVGGSTVRQLCENGVRVSIGGRSKANFERWQRRRHRSHESDDVDFVEVDAFDFDSVVRAVADYDVVVHTGGPFQGIERPTVLEACVSAGVASYVDVCDSPELSLVAKKLDCKNRTSAVVSCGIWPGLDMVMSLDAVELLGGASEVEALDFSFFTSGSGGAGPTILSATFLILAEAARGYLDGKEIFYPPGSGTEFVDFGEGIGRRRVFRMNFIESVSARETLGIDTIDTRFGTAPDIYNFLLRGVAMLPSWLLSDRDAMQSFALFSEPVVRLTDLIVGTANAMKVTAVAKDGLRHAVLTYAHSDLEECVGIATAAFALAALRGDVQPGVWWPEEAFGDVDKRKRLYADATKNAFTWSQEVTVTKS
jgi:saccharopine dehydrogenase-like NADP-dependent oxidoreductase